MKYIKKMIAVIAVIGGLMGTQISMAKVNDALDIPFGTIIIGSPSPAMSNLACSAAPVARTFQYTVQNTGQQSWELYNIHLIVNPADTFTGPASVSGCTGSLAPYNSCTLTLSLTPPTCAAGSQPLQQIIDRTIFIGVYNAAEPQVTTDVKSAVTTLGSGVNFAALGTLVRNTGGFGPAQIIGNIAATGSTEVDVSQFNLLQGMAYLHTDTVTLNANTDLSAAYANLTARKNLVGCNQHGNITTGQVFSSGYYCITTSPITVGGAAAIVFSGPGDFVFFVPDGVNLTFQNNAKFSFQNGASKNNVYWVVGNGEVILAHGAGTAAAPGASVVGTILTHGPVVVNAANPNSPALVQRIWSNYTPTASFPASIDLKGDTVSIQ